MDHVWYTKPPVSNAKDIPELIKFLCQDKQLVAQLYSTLCNSMGYSAPGSSVQGILQARILEWVAISYSRGSSWPRNQTPVSCIAGRFFTILATREAQIKKKALEISQTVKDKYCMISLICVIYKENQIIKTE